MSSESNKKGVNWSLYLQIATLLGVILSTIFTHYSQKSLIDHKANIEIKEPALIGTVVHAFLPEEYSTYNEVKLTNAKVMDGDEVLGDTMFLEDHLVNYPVLMALKLENHGNLKAEDISIVVTTPAGSYMRGYIQSIDYTYKDCSHENNKVRVTINCKSLRRGESRNFNFLWVPDFFSKDIGLYSIQKNFSTIVSTNDFIDAKAFSANGPEAIFIKGSIHAGLAKK